MDKQTQGSEKEHQPDLLFAWIRRFAHWVKARAAELRKRRLWFCLTLTIGLSAILVAGPYVQIFSTSLVSSDSASIYTGVLGDQITQFVSGSDWFGSILNPFYLACAAFIVLVSTAAKRARYFLFAASIASFVGLSAIDLILLLRSSSSSILEVVQCLISNLFGGFLLGSILLFMIDWAYKAKRMYGDHSAIGVALWISWPLIAGFLVSSILLFAFKVLLNITPTNFDLLAEVPLRGYYMAKDKESPSKGKPRSSKSVDQFGVLANVSGEASHVEWIGKGAPLVLRWKKVVPEPLEAKIQLFQGCSLSLSEVVSKLPSDLSKAWSVKDISELTIEFDPGLADFVIAEPDDSRGDMKVVDGELSQFSIDVVDEKRIKISRFTSSDAKFIHYSSLSPIRYAFGAILFGGDGENEKAVRRKISVLANGKKRTFEFESKKNVDFSKEMDCQYIDSRPLSGAPLTKFIVSQPYIGAVLTLIPPKSVSISSLGRSNELHASGLNGWFIADAVDKGSLKSYIDDGELSDLILVGSTKGLKLGDREFVPRPIDRIQIHGQIYGALERPGLFRFSGDADAVFFNGDRLSKTRWEKLDLGIRISILFGIPAALAFLIRNLFILVRTNKRVW